MLSGRILVSHNSCTRVRITFRVDSESAGSSWKYNWILAAVRKHELVIEGMPMVEFACDLRLGSRSLTILNRLVAKIMVARRVESRTNVVVTTDFWRHGTKRSAQGQNEGDESQTKLRSTWPLGVPLRLANALSASSHREVPCRADRHEHRSSWGVRTSEEPIRKLAYSNSTPEYTQPTSITKVQSPQRTHKVLLKVTSTKQEYTWGAI